MEDFRGHENWISVPQFGTWDGKTRDQTNYSMVFSQARANRKKSKTELMAHHSLGNERELLVHQKIAPESNPHAHTGMQRKCEKKTKKSISCFSCFYF
ncbi:uncharacterized protein LOC127259609 [Andrographis paniculata]|uniref:uncharacterized protein LOC127259609 n=1 Tax=Andrographis paniculata TaxID=175694 RepID=UPI0021E780E6|nr:uncharacterized protein LOC127259609 [Andrographis paniculata]